ncbi:hypothetical protein GWK47_032214 [Chionoecetes opilio]|uniref:Uncharacterized protein n=1 Tax=Chionoecetes opilio TaxID=41210 RepID=A0A8J5D4I1_CHIOP|nr:hypothetical protein GWK47_032214 [Chionoecetes opilio]
MADTGIDEETEPSNQAGRILKFPPKGAHPSPKASLEEALQYPSHFPWSTLQKPCRGHTTHPTTQGILLPLALHTVENALEMVPPHGGDALLPHSPPTRTTTRSPLKEGLPRGTVASQQNSFQPGTYPHLFLQKPNSLASTHHALYQRLVGGVNVVMVPTVQTCILEATNPDRIYGKATHNSVTTRPYSSSSACPRKSHLILAALSCLTCVRAGSPLTLKSTKRGKWSEETLLYRMEHSPSLTSNRDVDNTHDQAPVREDTPGCMSEARWGKRPHVSHHHVAVSTHALKSL